MNTYNIFRANTFLHILPIFIIFIDYELIDNIELFSIRPSSLLIATEEKTPC